MTKEKTPKDLIPADEITIKDLRKRRISEQTCRRFGYGCATYKGKNVQVAPYRDENGKLVAQKLRFPDKSFVVLGKMPDTLWGQHLWRKGGKRLVITEGEIDDMSVYEVISGRSAWPVVSLPSGSSSAHKVIAKQIEFVSSYDEVVLAFDMDEPGQEAAQKVSALLRPGQCKVAAFPRKDPSECLQEGLVKDLVSAIWEAQVRRPDGVINASELKERLKKPVEPGFEYPWPQLNEITYGQRPGEIVTWTAGSGLGKSAMVREIAHDLAMRHGLNVGYVALEENVERTGRGFLGLHIDRPIHLPGVEVTEEEIDRAFDETLGTGRFWLDDHWGSIEEDGIMSKLRYMAAMGCKFIVLDHLTIVMSGLALDNERSAIDQTMTRLRSFCEQTGVGIHLVSHLSRPKGNGRGHEDGAKPSLSELRGSHGIVQLSDTIIAAQRDASEAEEAKRNVTTLWVLKNRLPGETGVGTVVRYNKADGRLREVEWALDENGDVEIEPSIEGFDDDEGLSQVQGGQADF